MEEQKIIVASANETEQEDISRILETNNFNVLICRNFEELTARLEETEVSLLIISLHMEDKQGNPVCGTIRKWFSGKPLQIILITETPESAGQCLQSGGDDFVCLPIRPLEFLTRIQAAIIRGRVQQEIYTERDFFRNAVRYEEELSNRILDQHLHLKEAFTNIEKINNELEYSNRKLERIARFDILSGLLNRMSLFHTIDIEIERAVRTGRALCGIMIDLDYFKEINDNHGHQAGDEVIRIVGKMLNEEMRKYDQAGRYGGEEFFVVLPDSSLEQAFGIAERLQVRFAGTDIEAADTVLRVTASFGVAIFHPGESREHWMNRADKAMYRAKQSGRNRVVKMD